MITTEQTEAMRSWIRDCSWADEDDDSISGMSPPAIIRGVERHYCGGVAGFLVDCGI